MITGKCNGTDAGVVGCNPLWNDVHEWNSADETRRESGGVACGDREDSDSVD